jgi:nucleotide-binding universal stress UspA family protein
MYYLPDGPEHGRSPGAADACSQTAWHVTSDGNLEEAQRGRETRPRARADFSSERRIRSLDMNETSILVPVDGSTTAEEGVRHVIALSKTGMAMKVHLLNVQAEWAPSRSEYEKREGMALHAFAANHATGSARALLTTAGLYFESHFRIGVVADEIVKLASEKRCQSIVMGTRRLGTLAGLILGSVARTVVRRAPVPVTLVRET